MAVVDPADMQDVPATANPFMMAQGARMRAGREQATSVMDSRWDEQQATRNRMERDNLVMDVAMTAAPLVGPAARGVAAGARALAPQAARLADNYVTGIGGQIPLITWHGTPHTLPPTPRNPLGEFDLAKVGTGEGAQAYGHGTYLAEQRGVGEGYARNISGQKIVDSFGFQASRDRNAKAQAIGYFKDMLNGKAPRDIDALGKPISNVEINKQIEGLTQELGKHDAKFGVSSNLYKVDLPDEHIAKMLDWDKPLSQQPSNVVDAVARLNGVAPDAYRKMMAIDPDKFNKTGKEIYQLVANGRGQRNMGGFGIDPEAASAKLRELGIPGIKYLDGGSRTAGEGTRNFVVFDPKIANILERNGMAAPRPVAPATPGKK
tara:strand:- start:22 stop:1152 length:1131 start_codon:yes stop_codon:yes gene_type:complete